MISRLEQFKQSPEAFNLYVQGMSLVLQSGVIDALRELGRVQPAPDFVDNLGQIMAHRSERSLGFNQALDLLVNFRELILEGQPAEAPRPSFGAVDALLSRKDITEEEADVLRRK